MAFYNVNMKPVVESAVQDPDDIGVDLNQVEKDIAGPDGIEAHRDEVEAAEEGLIGDPVAEAFDIMYEAEYNYNQIMKCIGIHEISEASMGRELVLEAEDSKGFFARVKEILTKMFARITKAVKDILAKMDFQAKIDAKILSKKDEITKGAGLIEADTEGKWSFEGYEYGRFNAQPFEAAVKKAKAGKTGDMVKKTYDTVAAFANMTADEVRSEVEKDIADFDKALEDPTADAIHDIFGFLWTEGNTPKTISDLVKSLVETLRGNKVSYKAGTPGASKLAATAIKVLGDHEEVHAIRSLYKEVKTWYQDQLKMVNDMEKAVTKKTEYADYKLRICNAGTKVIKTQANVMNAGYGAFMKVARAKRAQYRRLAIAFARKGGVKENEVPAFQEGASSIFSGIKII